MLKKLSLVVLAGAMAVGLTACNDRDVAVGAAAVGSAIVVGSVYDNHYGRDYRHSRGYYRDGRSYWDRNDGRYFRRDNRWYRDRRGRDWDRGRNRWDGGRRGRGWDRGGRILLRTDASQEMNNNIETNTVDVASASADFNVASVNSQAAVAAKYRISNGAANDVINAFENIKRYGKLDALAKIGMRNEDIQRMSAGRSPSSASVASIARTLGARNSSVKALMQDVSDELSLRRQGTVTEL